MIYVDGKLAGIQERTGRRSDSVYLELEPGQTAVLRILVENMGRINYGAKLLDRKGILRGVKLGCQYQFGWKHYSLPCDCPPQHGYEPVGDGADAPLFLKGSFTVQQLSLIHIFVPITEPMPSPRWDASTIPRSWCRKSTACLLYTSRCV